MAEPVVKTIRISVDAKPLDKAGMKYLVRALLEDNEEVVIHSNLLHVPLDRAERRLFAELAVRIKATLCPDLLHATAIEKLNGSDLDVKPRATSEVSQ